MLYVDVKINKCLKTGSLLGPGLDLKGWRIRYATLFDPTRKRTLKKLEDDLKQNWRQPQKNGKRPQKKIGEKNGRRPQKNQKGFFWHKTNQPKWQCDTIVNSHSTNI